MSTRHIADAEPNFIVSNVTPDFCQVGSAIVPFDISQVLSPEKMGYAKTVFARGEKVLLVSSVISGISGNAGRGVKSGVSLGSGATKIVQGAGTVIIEGQSAARHGDQVLMNGTF
jgi:Domain of unknown function (DUF4150)